MATKYNNGEAASEISVPSTREEAIRLVNNLTIDDLRTFCSTFGLDDSGTREELRAKLTSYYETKFISQTQKRTYPKPTPRRRRLSDELSLSSNEDVTDRRLSASESRISRVEESVNSMAQSFREDMSEMKRAVQNLMPMLQEPMQPLLNGDEKIAQYTEEMPPYMTQEYNAELPSTSQINTNNQTYDKPSDMQLRKFNRKKRILQRKADQTTAELERLLLDKADVGRIERQLKKLHEIQSEYMRIVDEIVTVVDDDTLVDAEISQWEDLCADIVQTEDQAELYIQQASTKSEKLGASVKLPSLQLPKFNGKVLEWPAFHDAFVAAVHNNPKLSRVQKLTHLRSCLEGNAYHCIEGYAIVNDNYERALQDLINRFGRKRLVIGELVKSILELKIADGSDSKAWRTLYDTLRNRVRSLESHGLLIKDNPSLTMVLLPIFEMKLPGELREKWELFVTKQDSINKESIDLGTFFDFLEGHVLSKEARETVLQMKPTVKPRKRFPRQQLLNAKEERDEDATSAAALLGTNSRDFTMNKCGFCSENHATIRCPTAMEKTPNERWTMLKKNNAVSTCYNCLKRGSVSHNSRTCRASKCSVNGCGKRHHNLLHIESNKEEESSHNKTDMETLSGFMSSRVAQQHLLPTAYARLVYNDKECPVRVLFDSGSQETFIRLGVADDMGIKKDPSATTMKINVLGGEIQKKKVHRVSFKLLPMNSSHNSDATEMEAWTVNNVCVALEGVKFNKRQCAHLKNLELADNYPRKQASVDILVGADQYYKLVEGSIKRGKPAEPVATSSKLGWLLSGPVPGSVAANNQVASMLTVTKLEQPHYALEQFWELDAIGIFDRTRNSKYTSDEERAINQFTKDTTFENERYTVGLPWKENHPLLINNYEQAKERLIAQEKGLQRNPEKANAYCEAMTQYITNGHAREIDKDDDKADKIRYLPHHAVFRADKATTKCRVVFDASSKTPDGVSLNSCLLKGPKLQPDLVQVLIRFRSHKVALMADIKKMFLQIQLKRKDQNSHRFLWRDLEIDKEPKKYCMTRVTFGSTSSPFLSIATVQKHAREHQEQYPRAAEEILENMYVDDLLSGSEDDASALEMIQELTDLMHVGGFHLTKWASNSKMIMKSIPDEEVAPEVFAHEVISGDNESEKMSDLLKALGISWNISKDVFLFQTGSTPLQIPDALTKRSLLSLYPRLFDPLGFLTPYLIRPKLLFQKLWSRERDWDEPLDADIAQSWNAWKSELPQLEQIEIPRYFLPASPIEKIEVHGFGDASPKAYGAVVYLCTKDVHGNRTANLVMSKARVAPAKKMTLPRLELLGLYITAKLVEYVIQALRKPVDEFHAWSDSQIALSWIRNPDAGWKVFVSNRVNEINQRIEAAKWKYCPGGQNPADLVTRGIPINQLIDNTFWWHGPLWLQQNSSNWPQENCDDFFKDECLAEAKKSQNITSSNIGITNVKEYPAIATKYETWQRTIRILAWILKWTKRNVSFRNGLLSARELKNAEDTLLRMIQKKVFEAEYNQLSNKENISLSSQLSNLDPFYDEQQQLLRVGGRLQFAQIDLEAKHQIIIPYHDQLTEKLVLHLHVKAKHAGPETTLAILRQRYWLLHGRREVKRIIKKCLICKHWKTKPQEQKMAPLPKERVQVVPAFSNVGLDFMGPLYLKTKKKIRQKTEKIKAYVCIFICEDTRAVHFELTLNMTTEEFLQAFHRMANRRGLPRVIHSDNQTTFHKAARVFKASQQRLKLAHIDPKVVEEKLANEGITWKFITERASHRGGQWERVCRQLKEPLRKVLGKSLLTYTEMLTVLTDIEAIINSRPLTYIGDDIRDGIVVTPSLLTSNRNLTSVPDHVGERSDITLTDRYRYLQRLQNHFWNRWLKEYLPRLTVRQKWIKERQALKSNDIVLVTDDNIPRGKWILGKIEDTFSGADGLIRTVSVRTKKGIIRRPVQKLHLLEEHRDFTVNKR